MQRSSAVSLLLAGVLLPAPPTLAERIVDRIELGKVRFAGAALAKAPDGLALVGQGPDTVPIGLEYLAPRT